jgi:DNA replication and repair protein RecF
VGVINNYERALKQRNSLLKSRAPQSSLTPWDEHLANFGGEIIAERLKLISEIEPLFQEAYKKLSEKKMVKLVYKSSVVNADTNREENIANILTAILEISLQERERGISLIGPHRDDLLLKLGDQPVKGYASHGESWSIALALRLASYQLFTNSSEKPILILDDVFSELDESRREKLIEVSQSAEQTFITIAVENDLPKSIKGARFRVTMGNVVAL